MKTFDTATMRAKLTELYDEVVRIHQENKARGTSEISSAFDSGRCDGIKWALEIFDKETE
jgi:hypothetical protein